MIVEITDASEKQAIARKVLEALTDWFEVEESREEYISACADWTFFAAKEDKEAIGFLCLKETGKATVENHLKIDNSKLEPDQVADQVIEAFGLTPNVKEEKEYRYGI